MTCASIQPIDSVSSIAVTGIASHCVNADLLAHISLQHAFVIIITCESITVQAEFWEAGTGIGAYGVLAVL